MEEKKTEREQTTIRLTAELKKQLQKQADCRGISFNGVITEAIIIGLAELEEQFRRGNLHNS